MFSDCLEIRLEGCLPPPRVLLIPTKNFSPIAGNPETSPHVNIGKVSLADSSGSRYGWLWSLSIANRKMFVEMFPT